MEDEKSYKTEDDIYFKKYIKINQIEDYSQDNLIDKKNSEDLICPICYCILKEPINCSDKKNSHSFCKECIDKNIQENNNKCPLCKLNFEYKNNNEINIKLSKLIFKCLFKDEGCNNIIKYSDYLDHINNCIYSKYKCQIKKYNYNKKKFEICGFSDNIQNIENHIKICAFVKYNCLFCNENILRINLEEHVNNKCKMRIKNFNDGDIYLGEIKNNLREGYGINYYNDGDKYEGEWKNNNREGYGIYYYNNGTKYEGEWKNNNMEGYGIFYYNNGNKYEGEWKNNNMEGLGVLYGFENFKYQGYWKNDKFNGYGI